MVNETRVLPELLTGRSAVIAGGTGSVGRHLVAAFLSAGATVVVPSRSTRKIEDLRQSIGPRSAGRLITFEGDLGDESGGDRMREHIVGQVGPVDAVVASLGGFVPAPSVLDAPPQDLERALQGYLVAHFLVARALVPALKDDASYTFINGPLAFDPLFPGTGLVSVATAGQAMLARVVMKEMGDRIRVNELVIYTRFGWGDDDGRGVVSQEDVGRYSALLASDSAARVRGETIHLNTLEPLHALMQES